MTKDEYYATIILITLILLSVVWKAELDYRISFVETKSNTSKTPVDSNYIFNHWLGTSNQSKSTTQNKSSIEKKKESWMEAYRSGIRFNYSPKWNR